MKLTLIWYAKRKIIPGKIRQPSKKLTAAPGELRNALMKGTFSWRQMSIKCIAENITM